MAGRVERRINNKFYFVLDEVGDSSDCESEHISENDVKTSDGINSRDDKFGTKIKDTCLSKNNNTDGETDQKYLYKTIPDSLNHDTEILETQSFSQESKETSENAQIISDTGPGKSPCQYTINADSDVEETAAVVDMDIDSDLECVDTNEKPLLRITFRDEKIEELLKSSLYKFFSQQIKDCTIISNSENVLELEVYDKSPTKLLADGLVDFDLDTTPGDDQSGVPFYGKPHDLVLSDKNLGKNDNKKLSVSTSICFNCSGDHVLKDCPKKKDFRVINKNRLKFQKQNKSINKNSRYHLDENQKFSHIIPGVISKKLRNALNLRRDQQPGFIYRMRLLGYPPAWLEEAKVSHSGVVMYDSIGVPVLEEDEEEGEIIPEGSKDKFDITKIIDFPGFNVPLPNNFKDESKLYYCPALSEDQSKENLIKLLEPKTVQAYVKKSLNSQKEEEKNTIDSAKRILSPTIEEMEEKKRQLLMELNIEDSALDSKMNSDDSVTGTSAIEPKTVQSNQNLELGSVKNLEFGTPILKSVSPFSKLPSREQFSVNVSDIINFENLPNSTGKYETMRQVIIKIRDLTSKTQSG